MTEPFEGTVVTLNRQLFTDYSTIGELTMDSQHQCWTLEPPVRKAYGGYIAIPAGTYEVIMEWSARFQMQTPHVHNVPGRTFIEIHPGNQPSDTEGCILLGLTRERDWIGSSRSAYMRLVTKLREKLVLGKLFIEIVGEDQRV